MIHKYCVLFRPVMVAAVLSAVVPAHAQQTEKFAPAAIEAAAQKVSQPAAPQCSAPRELTRLDLPLARTGRLLAAGLPIRIVALGSSSTAGAGASSPEHSYPAQLAMELRERFPDHEITVLNRGVNGEEAEQMMARLESTVIAERPDLVLWQVGTNTVLRDNPIEPASSLIDKGIARMQAQGIDVVLIDPQFAPKVIGKDHLSRMINLLAAKARHYKINVFRRFAVMRDWRERQGIPFDAFVSPDQLHMNDWSYACVARVLSAAIADAAVRPVSSASAHVAR